MPLILFVILVLLSANFPFNAPYKVRQDVTTIFIGDSHIQTCVDDATMPGCLNVASSSESFYFSYYKLKYLLKQNPNVKQVFLGFSFHSISDYYDKFIFGEYSPDIAPKYYSTLPASEQFRMLYWNKSNFAAFMKGLIREGMGHINAQNYYPFIGGYYSAYSETAAVDSSMDKRLNFQFYYNHTLSPFSEINIKYLEKIKLLCKAVNVELIVLNTPLHKYYYSKVPNKYKNKLNDLIKTCGLNYADISNIQLNDSCYLPDGDHVSQKGMIQAANYLSKYVYK